MLTKLRFTPMGISIVEVDEDGEREIPIHIKNITSLDVKNINLTGGIDVAITFTVDEIDMKYSSNRTRFRELRNELSKKT